MNGIEDNRQAGAELMWHMKVIECKRRIYGKLWRHMGITQGNVHGFTVTLLGWHTSVIEGKG